MRKINWFSVFCLVLLGFIAGGFVFGATKLAQGYIPPLKIVGDVTACLTLEDPRQIGRLERISHDGKRYRAAKLSEIINKAEPAGELCQLYLVASDGFTVSLKAERLEKCYIAFTAQNGWEAINLNHPVSSNAKSLQKIVVVTVDSDDLAREAGFTVIDQDTDLAGVTAGQLHTRVLAEYPYLEGIATADNDGQTYEASVYTRRKIFPLSDLTPVGEQDLILVVGAGGEHRWADNRGYFELKENYVDYLQLDERGRVEKVKGVIVNPPAAAITDAYYDARHYLESGARVLVVVLDGFNYSQCAYAMDNGHAPFLKKTGRAVKATGVYPPRANVWLAAMITGKPPQENGVVTGNDQDLKAPSLFTVTDKLQKKALILQSGPQTIHTEIEPVVCGGQYANEPAKINQTSDQELYRTTLAHLDKDYDLIMVCFHGIAVNGERYGRTSSQTMDAVSAIDGYLEEMVGQWPGKIIVAAAAGRGSGGSSRMRDVFSCETMFAPYWRLN